MFELTDNPVLTQGSEAPGSKPRPGYGSSVYEGETDTEVVLVEGNLSESNSDYEPTDVEKNSDTEYIEIDDHDEVDYARWKSMSRKCFGYKLQHNRVPIHETSEEENVNGAAEFAAEVKRKNNNSINDKQNEHDQQRQFLQCEHGICQASDSQDIVQTGSEDKDEVVGERETDKSRLKSTKTKNSGHIPGNGNFAEASKKRVKGREEIPSDDELEFDRTSTTELRRQLKAKGMKCSGLKATLWERLKARDTDASSRVKVKEAITSKHPKSEESRKELKDKGKQSEPNQTKQVTIIPRSKDGAQSKEKGDNGQSSTKKIAIPGNNNFKKASRQRVKNIEQITNRDLARFHKMTANELKEQLKTLGLSRSGGKVELFLRYKANVYEELLDAFPEVYDEQDEEYDGEGYQNDQIEREDYEKYYDASNEEVENEHNAGDSSGAKNDSENKIGEESQNKKIREVDAEAVDISDEYRNDNFEKRSSASLRKRGTTTEDTIKRKRNSGLSAESKRIKTEGITSIRGGRRHKQQ